MLDETITKMIKTLQDRGGFTVKDIADVFNISEEEVKSVLRSKKDKCEDAVS
jgi:DNA-directed RNA polymerase specialized sigma24 family protein